jgi:hypothetical protein
MVAFANNGDDSIANQISLVSGGVSITPVAGSQDAGIIRVAYIPEATLASTGSYTNAEIMAYILDDTYDKPAHNINLGNGIHDLRLHYVPYGTPNKIYATSKATSLGPTLSSTEVPPCQLWILKIGYVDDFNLDISWIRNYEYDANVAYKSFVGGKTAPSMTDRTKNSLRDLHDHPDAHATNGPRNLSVLETPGKVARSGQKVLNDAAKYVSFFKPAQQVAGLGSDIAGTLADVLEFGDDALDSAGDITSAVAKGGQEVYDFLSGLFD